MKFNNAPARAFFCLFLLFSPWLGAQFPAPPPAAEVSARRNLLAKRLEGEGFVFLPGAQRSAGYSEFRQSNDFYYLTGLEVPDAYLLLDIASGKSILYLPGRTMVDDIEGVLYESADAVRRQTGIDEIRVFKSRAALEEIKTLLGNARILWTPFDPEEIGGQIMDSARPEFTQREKHPWERFKTREAGTRMMLKEHFESAEIKNLTPHIRALRTIKSPWEIEMIRQACRISAASMVEVMKMCAPGRYEYELGAVATYTSQRLGAQGPAYFPIVGSGPNSCIVHYWKKSRRLEDGDMLVVDAACSYGYYVSDITRSFPANGRFTDEQKRVYNAVLEAQTECIKEAKPGVPLSHLQGLATKILKKHNLDRYFTHGLSHHVGMAVHDPGNYFGKLEPGHVLTIEPGAYLKESAIGVRIEDIIVITEDGNEILTGDVPKDIAAVEALLGVNAKK